MDLKIGIEGLKDLNKSLRTLDSEAPKALRLALNSSADIFIGEVRLVIPKRTGRAAASLKAASTRTAVRIRVGGPKAPYYPWLDFGGRVGPKKSVVRPFYREGRYIYPTLRKERAKFESSVERALGDLIRTSGLDAS
jgi:hypothetical protein